MKKMGIFYTLKREIMGLKDHYGTSSREVDQKLLRKVLKQVCDKQATYPSEVSYFVQEDKDKVGLIMRQLEQVGILERLIPQKKNGDRRLLKASIRTDKRSLEQMKQPNWYGLNSDMDWEIKQTSGEVIDEYGNVIEDHEGVDQNIVDKSVKRMKRSGLM